MHKIISLLTSLGVPLAELLTIVTIAMERFTLNA